ncbi:hypothetical protein A5904_07955 [Acidithiobacillus caldus]|uniref:hypothetical protein n=1 Tax=Acidithiobacillus caldus TaxID=33059 RepID=UPI0007DA45A3|nr:hypothetical protein [Acidithiobacillus caldus]AUW32878.1 hypothetical protein A5904_07955 [Acidithiobacillus caldus]QER45533.1 hypothetical protein F0726_02478 [Acidithiobacillus caldus]
MKKNRLFVLFVGANLLATAATADASIYWTMNQVDVSGNVQGTTNQYGNTAGGLGVRGSLFDNGLFGTVKYRHQFGPAYQGYTGGDSNTFGLEVGYLFAATPFVAVGPYLGYEYNRFSEHDAYLNSQASQSLDNLGGGLYAAASLPFANVTAHLGYLGGVSETSRVTGFPPLQYNRSSNLLQMGVNLYLPLVANLDFFVGLHDDDFTQAGAPNLLRGDVGVGASF